MRAGLIIAGGRSTRFGEQDKAVADLAGTPMIRRVADRITAVTDEFVVNCREDQISPIEEALSEIDQEPAYAEDPDPDKGPMAGIMTGLRTVDSEYAFVVACDMPFVDPALVEYLFERTDGHDAAIPRTGEWYQPTQAVYRATSMANACEAALDRGDRRIVAALDDLDFVEIDSEEFEQYASSETFENLNTREELDAAAEHF
jgi:molybdopterin-guanine dinucleotide biosynthesis protein A